VLRGLVPGESDAMTTVAISDKYVDVLSALGDVESAVDLALQRYTIEQITARIGDLRRRDATYRAKYGMEYATFARRAAAEESFIERIERQVSKTWEIDLADWEFCHKGAEDWTHRQDKYGAVDSSPSPQRQDRVDSDRRDGF
jgi:hypothetical protein